MNGSNVLNDPNGPNDSNDPNDSNPEHGAPRFARAVCGVTVP